MAKDRGDLTGGTSLDGGPGPDEDLWEGFKEPDEQPQDWQGADPSELPARERGTFICRALDAAYHKKVAAEVELMRAIRWAHEHEVPDRLEDHIIPWLYRYLNIAYRAAEQLVEVALALGDLPQLEKAFLDGRLSYDHLRMIVSVATPDNESELVDRCSGISVGKARALAEKMRKVSRQEAEETRRSRRLEKSWDREHRVLHVYAQLPDEMGVRFEKAIDGLASKLPHRGPDGYVDMDTRRADALLEMADSTLSKDPSLPQVVVHVDAAELIADEGTACLKDGPKISSETARRMFCESIVQVVAVNEKGQPVGFGRAKRTPPPKMRRELERRDGGCAFPGCNRKGRLATHHIKHWTRDGGPTDYDNLVSLCPDHHPLFHEGGWSMSGVPPDIEIRRPDGSLFTLGPPRRRGP